MLLSWPAVSRQWFANSLTAWTNELEVSKSDWGGGVEG